MKKRQFAVLFGILLGLFLYGIASKNEDYYHTWDHSICWGVNADSQLGNGICIATIYYYHDQPDYFNEYYDIQIEFITGGGWSTDATNLYVIRPFSIQRYKNYLR